MRVSKNLFVAHPLSFRFSICNKCCTSQPSGTKFSVRLRGVSGLRSGCIMTFSSAGFKDVWKYAVKLFGNLAKNQRILESDFRN